MSKGRRRHRFDVVRSGLELLVVSAGINAALLAANRALTAFIWSGTLSFGSSNHGLYQALSSVIQLGFIGAGIAAAIGAWRLAELPPTPRTEKARAMYRDAPVTTLAPAQRGLARAVFALAVGEAALGVIEMIVYRLLPVPASGRAVYTEALWIASLLTGAATTVTLMVWVTRVARAFDVRLSTTMPIAILVTVVVRDAFLIVRLVAHARLPGWTSWMLTGVAVAIQVGSVVLLGNLRRSLAALPARDADEPDSSPRDELREGPGEASPRWIAAASGLALYATLVKAKIAAAIAGGLLIILMVTSKSSDGAMAVVVLMQLTAMGITVAMIVALARWARVPEESDATAAAQLALMLFCVNGLLDLYGLSVLLDLFGDQSSARREAGDQMIWVQIGGTAVGGFALLALLTSLRRAARFVGAHVVADRARTLMVILVASVTGSGAITASIRGTHAAAGLTLLLPVVLIVALFSLLSFLGVLHDLRVAITSWSEPEEHDDVDAPRPFRSHLR